MRLFRPNIRRLEGRRDIRGLAAALGDQDWHIRGAAQSALVWIGGDSVIDELIIALENEKEEVRSLAVETLDKLGGIKKGLDSVINHALNDGSPYVRHKCINALSKIDDDRAIETLCQALDDERKDIGKTAREALTHIGPASIDHLIPRLKARSGRQRSLAVWALGDIVNERVVSPLIDVLKEEKHSVIAINAIMGLGKQGDIHAIPYLMPFLIDPGQRLADRSTDLKEIKKQTWNSLFKILEAFQHGPVIQLTQETGVEISRALLQFLESNHDRGIVVKALMRFGEYAVEPLCDGLKSKDTVTIAGAAEVLGKLGNPKAIRPLLEALDGLGSSGNLDCCITVGKALAKFPDAGVNQRLKDLALQMRPTRYWDEALGCLTNREGVDNEEIIGSAFSSQLAADPLFTSEKPGGSYSRKTSALWHWLSHTSDVNLRNDVLHSLAILGDLRAADMVIDDLFGETRSLLNHNTKLYTNLFRDYTKMIIVAVYSTCSQGDEYFSQPWSYEGSYDEIYSLESPITSNLLHKLSEVRDIEYEAYDANTEYYYTKSRSFAVTRSNALHELARRGNPPYDPLVYLIEKNWHISSSGISETHRQ